MEMFGHQYHILYFVFHKLGLALIFDVKSVSHIFGLRFKLSGSDYILSTQLTGL